jgi:hypothetical protein
MSGCRRWIAPARPTLAKLTQELARSYKEQILIKDADDEHGVGLRDVDHGISFKFMKESKTRCWFSSLLKKPQRWLFRSVKEPANGISAAVFFMTFPHLYIERRPVGI